MAVDKNNIIGMTDRGVWGTTGRNVCGMTDKNVCPTGMRMTDRNVCPTGRRGMTLVEILTVLAIITTLLLIGWGVMYKIIDPASRESAQNQISAALNGARNRAMSCFSG